MGKAAKRRKEAFVPQREILFNPLNQTQAEYFQALNEDTITFALGSAGTGKSFCACTYAAKQIDKDLRKKVVLARATQGLGKTLGYLPGDVESKYEPWLMPMIIELKNALGKGVYECKRRNGQIEYQLLEVVRGRSYDDTIILVDEAQNLTLDELKALSTRVGKGSQLVLMGDTAQHDMNGDSPIERFQDILFRHKVRDTSLIRFDRDDIVRSDIVRDLVIAFEDEGI